MFLIGIKLLSIIKEGLYSLFILPPHIHEIPLDYTLYHPENDRDVTERVQEYTLQDASFMGQSRCSFLNVCENAHVARAVTSVFLRCTR